VTSANHYLFVFTAAGNHDPDGDSNGTSVIIRRQ
jgi:hypothetical protein